MFGIRAGKKCSHFPDQHWKKKKSEIHNDILYQFYYYPIFAVCKERTAGGTQQLSARVQRPSSISLLYAIKSVNKTKQSGNRFHNFVLTFCILTVSGYIQQPDVFLQ